MSGTKRGINVVDDFNFKPLEDLNKEKRAHLSQSKRILATAATVTAVSFVPSILGDIDEASADTYRYTWQVWEQYSYTYEGESYWEESGYYKTNTCGDLGVMAELCWDQSPDWSSETWVDTSGWVTPTYTAWDWRSTGRTVQSTNINAYTDTSTYRNRTATRINAQPVFNVSNMELNSNESKRFNLGATDADGNAMTYTISSSNTNIATASISSTGEVTLQAKTNVGQTNITVNVRDSYGETTTKTFTVKVTNTPPVVSNIENVTINANEQATRTFTVTDPEGQTVTNTISQTGTGFTATLSGNTITIKANESGGTGTVTLRSTDTGGLSGTKTFNVNVVNRAPEVSVTATNTSLRNKIHELEIAAHDLDGSAITSYEVTANNSNVTVSGSGSKRTLNIGNNIGDTELTIKVTDAGGAVTTKKHVITVTNQKPTLTSDVENNLNHLVLDKTKEHTFKGTAQDADIEDVIVSARHEGLTFSTAKLTGEYGVTLKGADYTKGFYTSNISLVSSDGLDESTEENLLFPVIVVSNADDYTDDMVSHASNYNNWTKEQHGAFYTAYEALHAYEKSRTVGDLSTYDNTVQALKDVTVTDSITMTAWKERRDNVFATVAVENAELSLVKADYGTAESLVDNLLGTVEGYQEKEALKLRTEELKRYHIADEALKYMEEDISKATWELVFAAQDKIDVVENTVNNATLQLRLDKIKVDYMSNIPDGGITEEDLGNFGVEDVRPELVGLYKEYHPVFKPLGQDNRAQELVTFVNQLVDTVTTMTSSEYATYLSVIPSYAQEGVKNTTDNLADLLHNRTNILTDRENETTTLSTYNFEFTITSEYFNNVAEALKEVREYNLSHTETDLEEGYTELTDLWEGQLKTDLESYLTNGIPQINIVKDDFEYINTGQIIVKGQVDDSDGEEITVEVTYDGETKTVKTTDGSFAIPFNVTKGNIHNDDILIRAFDKLSVKKYTIDNKPVIKVASDTVFGFKKLEVAKNYAKYLQDDLGLDFGTITDGKLTDLMALYERTIAVNYDSQEREIRAIENTAIKVGNGRGKVEVYTKQLIQQMRLEWVFEHYDVATTDDYLWSGVENVTDDNVEALRSIVHDYATNNENPPTPTLTMYAEWLGLAPIILQAEKDVATLKAQRTVETVKDKMPIAVSSVAKIPTWLTVGKELTTEIRDVEVFLDALELQLIAEADYTQANVDTFSAKANEVKDEVLKEYIIYYVEQAQVVVNAVQHVNNAFVTLANVDVVIAQAEIDLIEHDTVKKAELQTLLNGVAATVTARGEVEKAEGLLTQEQHDIAKELVDDLVESTAKAEYIERLVEVQKLIDSDNLEKDSTTSTEEAEDKLNQEDKDNAQDKVDQLPDGDLKDELQDRLDEVQDKIDASNAVDNAEETLSDKDIEDAQTAIDEVEDGEFKQELQDRLDKVKEENAIIKEAIENAENTLTQETHDTAKDLVDNIIGGNFKEELLERLEEVQDKIDAQKAVEVAEESIDSVGVVEGDRLIADAQEKIDAVEDGEFKTGLQDRLDEVENKHNEYKDHYKEVLEKVITAEREVTQSAIDEARESVETLREGVDKDNLAGRLDAVQLKLENYEALVQKAISAVEHSEQTYDYTDKTYADSIVNLLDEGEVKTQLEERLQLVQEVINTVTLVDRAERTKKQADVTTAQMAVDSLDDSVIKTELNNRLAIVQAIIDAGVAVELAEKSLEQSDKDSAQLLVTDLVECKEKTNYQKRLDAIQAKIDKAEEDAKKEQERLEKEEQDRLEKEEQDRLEKEEQDRLEKEEQERLEKEEQERLEKEEQEEQERLEQEKESEEAVGKAEGSKEEEDIKDAQDKVDALPDSDKKDELQDRLDDLLEEVEKDKEEQKEIEDAKEAVDKAEETGDAEDISKAEDLVDKLPDGKDKDDLLDRLDDIKENNKNQEKDENKGEKSEEDILDDLINNPSDVTKEDFENAGVDITDEQLDKLKDAVEDYIDKNGSDGLTWDDILDILDKIKEQEELDDKLLSLLAKDKLTEKDLEEVKRPVKSQQEADFIKKELDKLANDKGKSNVTAGMVDETIVKGQEKMSYLQELTKEIVNLALKDTVSKSKMKEIGVTDVTLLDLDLFVSSIKDLVGQVGVDGVTYFDLLSIIEESKSKYNSGSNDNTSVKFDDIEGHWSSDAVTSLADRGIVNGVGDGLFAPNSNITRAQYAAIIARALNLESNEEGQFTDVQGKWYESYVQALFEAGITTGKTDEIFDPEGTVTRQQAMAMLGRLLDYSEHELTELEDLVFVDSYRISDYAVPEIQKLVSIGAVEGDKDEVGVKINPKDNLTRAQMAKIVSHVLQTIEE